MHCNPFNLIKTVCYVLVQLVVCPCIAMSAKALCVTRFKPPIIWIPHRRMAYMRTVYLDPLDHPARIFHAFSDIFALQLWKGAMWCMRLLLFWCIAVSARSTRRTQHVSTKRLFATTAVEPQHAWDAAVSGAHLSISLPSAKCVVCPRASMQSADGSTRLFTSSSGFLTFERVGDQTVLWSSGGQPQAAGAVDADAAARGLFLQATGQLLLGDVDADRKTLLAGSAIYWQQLHAPAQAGSFLLVGNDESFGVYRNTTTTLAAASCIWTSASELTSGLSVTAPHSFYTASRVYELRLQIDGNLVLYETSSSSIVWQLATSCLLKPSLYMTTHLEGTSIISQCRALLSAATSSY
eukprot:21506-Heterococcus_DN1.PRE.3